MNLRLLLEKATSGKWEWDHGDVGTDHSEPYCTIYKDGGDLIIAEVNDKFSTEEGHANAALIVALHNCAPELLAVAEAAESYIDEVDNGLISGTHDRRAHMLHVTRAALAVLKEKEAKVCP